MEPVSEFVGIACLIVAAAALMLTYVGMPLGRPLVARSLAPVPCRTAGDPMKTLMNQIGTKMKPRQYVGNAQIVLLIAAGLMVGAAVYILCKYPRTVAQSVAQEVTNPDSVLTAPPSFGSFASAPEPHGSQPLVLGDRATFIKDVTIPDGSPIKTGTRFVKIWVIANTGSVPWASRSMVREGNSEGPGTLKSLTTFRIPDTLPGQRCTIGTEMEAPSQPGSAYAGFKMVDKTGRYALPNQIPIYVSINCVN